MEHVDDLSTSTLGFRHVRTGTTGHDLLETTVRRDDRPLERPSQDIIPGVCVFFSGQEYEQIQPEYQSQVALSVTDAWLLMPA